MACSIYFNIIVIPEGHIGLLKERTRGWDQSFLEPGYHWVSTAFIPLKWKLYLVNLHPPETRIYFKVPLRYTEYLELSNLFKTQVEIKVQYRLQKEKIDSLINSLGQNINRLEQYIQEKIVNLLELKYFEFYRSDFMIPILKARLTQYINSKKQKDSFSSDWKELFRQDGIEMVKFDLIKVYVPDYSLYQAQIKGLDSFLSKKRAAIMKNIDTEAEIHKIKLYNMAELEKAKEVLKLLDKNPRILEYLKYQNLNPKTSVIRIESEKQGNSYFQSDLRQKYNNNEDYSDSDQLPQQVESKDKDAEDEEAVGTIPPIRK